MLGYIVSVLIFASFCGVLLVGFYVYTKRTEAKFKKEMAEKVRDVKDEIAKGYESFTNELCERALCDMGIDLKSSLNKGV